MEKRGRESKGEKMAGGDGATCFETIALHAGIFSLKAKAKSRLPLLAKVIGPTMAHRRTSCMLPPCLVLAAALLRIADAQLPATDLGTCQVRPFF